MGKDRRVACFFLTAHFGIDSSPSFVEPCFCVSCVILPGPSCSSSGVQGCSCRSTTPEHHLFAGVGGALVSVRELEDKS